MSCRSSTTCTSSWAGRLFLPCLNTPQVVPTRTSGASHIFTHVPALTPLPPLSRFGGRVRPRASEYPGRRGSSSDHGSRELPGPPEPAPCLRERLQAVSQVSAQPVVRVHQTGQEHRHDLYGRPPAARSVRRKLHGKHGGDDRRPRCSVMPNQKFSFRVGSGENGAGAPSDGRRHQRLQI